MPDVIDHKNLFIQAPFTECHASTLADADGGLICSWFGGSEEGRADAAIWSEDGGRTWSRPWKNETLVSDFRFQPDISD